MSDADYLAGMESLRLAAAAPAAGPPAGGDGGGGGWVREVGDSLRVGRTGLAAVVVPGEGRGGERIVAMGGFDGE